MRVSCDAAAIYERKSRLLSRKAAVVGVSVIAAVVPCYSGWFIVAGSFQFQFQFDILGMFMAPLERHKTARTSGYFVIGSNTFG